VQDLLKQVIHSKTTESAINCCSSAKLRKQQMQSSDIF